MSQVTSSPPQPVIDYNTRPAPQHRSSWLNIRVILFILVFGAIIGAPVYMYLDMALTQGIHARADGVTEVDLKAMSLFPLDQINGQTVDVPERFRALDGKKVQLVGEMYAPNAAGDAVGQFDLVYSIAKCCFSGPPQVQHFVKSTPEKAGAGMPYYSGLVKVTGTLHVGVTRDTEAGKVGSVYKLTVDQIDPI